VNIKKGKQKENKTNGRKEEIITSMAAKTREKWNILRPLLLRILTAHAIYVVTSRHVTTSAARA